MISETLLEFFGPENWPYLLDPNQYGIIGAKVTSDPGPLVHARIVLKTESGNTWSIIRTRHTPPGLWEAVRIGESKGRLLGDPKHYELSDLLAIINQKYWDNEDFYRRADSRAARGLGQPCHDVRGQG